MISKTVANAKVNIAFLKHLRVVKVKKPRTF